MEVIFCRNTLPFYGNCLSLYPSTITPKAKDYENNPFIHHREKIEALETKDSGKFKTDSKFSVAMLEIDEGE